MDLGITGKRAIVLGASRGFGMAIAPQSIGLTAILPSHLSKPPVSCFADRSRA